MPTNSSTILVVGGAGYIGSHMVLALRQAGFSPIVLDNLSNGHRDAVLDAPLIVGEMGDKALLNTIFSTHTISAVMHFGGYIEVKESVDYPQKYYQNNVAATLTLLDVMLQHEVKHCIFSSTAAVYGEPQYTPIDEAHPLHPINPYGRSKRMVEEIIQDYASSSDLHYAILRYFNAAGADPEGRIGERHAPESHLIPLLLQVVAGQRKDFTLNGLDYATPDGTCVRDFIHVADLCAAHLRALESLLQGTPRHILNLGTGHGYSILQVLAAVKTVTGQSIPIIQGPRRQGDPALLVADARLARKELAWEPCHSDITKIVTDTWRFMRSRERRLGTCA